MTAEIHLPFPISVNRLWRVVGKRLIKSEQYRAWLKNAHGFMLYTGSHKCRVKGKFRYKVVLSEAERGRSKDGDNYSSKAILDLLQSCNIIENDSLAEGGSWEWGEAPHGCKVELVAA